MNYFKYIPYLFHTIYFNFKYLSFRQAIKLPIFLYKPKLLKLKGKVIIDADRLETGVIRLGEYRVSLFPNTGILWQNHGGIVIFQGKCRIGNDSKVSIGTKGRLIFGDAFSSSTSLKVVCYHHILFDYSVRVGWDVTFMDTDFHKIKTLDGKESKGYGAIKIGSNNWFGNGCLVLKNTKTSDYTIIAARSILNKQYDYPSYSLIGGNPVSLLKSGVYRDVLDDRIDYG